MYTILFSINWSNFKLNFYLNVNEIILGYFLYYILVRDQLFARVWIFRIVLAFQSRFKLNRILNGCDENIRVLTDNEIKVPVKLIEWLVNHALVGVWLGDECGCVCVWFRAIYNESAAILNPFLQVVCT